MSKVVCPYIGLEIGLGHFLCAVLFEDIDKVVREGIGIWNWIGLYLRSCILSKPCIGLEIGFGHFLEVICLLDIDIMLSQGIGIGNWIWV